MREWRKEKKKKGLRMEAKEEDHKLEASLKAIASSRSVWGI
jgi:hypothetical protein